MFQLAVEEQEKKLKEFVTVRKTSISNFKNMYFDWSKLVNIHINFKPDVAFLFCVKIDEVKDMQFPKDCSNLNDFYFNIYIVNNKKKDHNKLSYCDEGFYTLKIQI